MLKRVRLAAMKKNNFFAYAILLSLFVVPTWAMEKEPSAEDQVLTRLMTMSSYKGIQVKVASILKHDEARYTPECSQLATVEPVEITVLEEPEFAENQTPVKGSWMVRYEMDVCGQKLLRAIYFQVSDEQISMASLLPGNTKTDPQLQKDVTRTFKEAVLRAYPDCKIPFVTDTRLLALPKNGDAPWEELWVMNACNNVFGQAIRFVPQDDGTAFSLYIPTKQ